MKDTLLIKTNQQLTKPQGSPVSFNKPSTSKQSPVSFQGGVARYSPIISLFK